MRATWSGRVTIIDGGGEAIGLFEAHLFSERDTWGLSKWWGHLKPLAPAQRHLSTAAYTIRLLREGGEQEAIATLEWNGSTYTVRGHQRPPF